MPDEQNPFSAEFLRNLPAHSDRRDGFFYEISGGISKLRLRLSCVDHTKLTEEQRQENKNAIARAGQLAFDFDTVRQQFLKGLLTKEGCMDCVRELCEDYARSIGMDVEDGKLARGTIICRTTVDDNGYPRRDKKRAC